MRCEETGIKRIYKKQQVLPPESKPRILEKLGQPGQDAASYRQQCSGAVKLGEPLRRHPRWERESGWPSP